MNTLNTPGHRFLEHTADVAIEAWAPSPEALLLEAARAVMEILTESVSVEPNEERAVHVDSSDEQDRLVGWLNEVLWLAIGKGFVLTDAKIVLRRDGLDARVWGRGDASHLVLTEIKSATYHDLHLAQEPSGRYVARVVLDV
jgi:SHS2 domain-containing protein